MPKLENTKIYRGPSTYWDFKMETISCTVEANSKDLEFEFEIGSAGGGYTRIILNINKDDFPVIFKEIAESMPSASSLFSKCASIATERKVKNKLINKFSKELDSIEGYISNKKTDKAINKIGELIGELEDL